MAPPSGSSLISVIFQSDENVTSLRLIESPEEREAGLEMGRNSNRVVLFTVVGVAVYTSSATMVHAEAYVPITFSANAKGSFHFVLVRRRFACGLMLSGVFAHAGYRSVSNK